MKATGIVRQLDMLGRVVLPIEMRRTMDIQQKDSVEIYVDGDSIILRKHHPVCIFCNSKQDLGVYKDKLVCNVCRRALCNIILP